MTIEQPETAPRSRTARPARMIVRRAAVLGAGTMGAQIAAQLANSGVAVDLLDLPHSPGAEDDRPAPALAARDRLLKLKPAPLYGPVVLDRIRAGTFDDDLERIAGADWVIEAVIEKLEPKRELWARAAPHIRPDAIASTNTSGIRVASIAEALPAQLRTRFLGTHFFNPPRYVRLLEVIPTPKTESAVVQDITRFAEDVLGKGVVVARDVPNFIANRIGCFGLLDMLRAMQELGLGPDEVDSVTGPAMGRPRSATFRTLDLIGLDVFLDVCRNMPPDGAGPFADAFSVPEAVLDMVSRGWLGEKSGQGFYRRSREGGETQILALDLVAMEYRPSRRLEAPSLAAVRGMEDAAERLRTLAASDDRAGALVWRSLAGTLAYSAWQIGPAAADVVSADRALRWGFTWDIGPFEAWDAIGLAPAAARMARDDIPLPGWVEELAGRDGSFYTAIDGAPYQATPEGDTAPVHRAAKAIDLKLRAAARPLVSERPGATIVDIGDGIAFLDFHSPKQAIGPDMLATIHEAACLSERGFQGVVVGSHVRPNFCVGANLTMILLAAQDGEWEEIDAIIRSFQDGLMGLKYAPIPVVAAPFGLALGGGAEILLAADGVVAAAESYIGLVEFGAGLIPAGGGCKEMLIRSLEGVPGGIEALTDRRRGVPRITPDLDPNPAIAQIFETIAAARVSGSADEARGLGFLRRTDVVVPNLDRLLYTAKEEAKLLAQQVYAPPAPRRLPVLGETARATLRLAARHLVWAGQASEHDLKIAAKLAYVLTGGDLPPGSAVGERHFLDLEREAFLSLCGEQMSIDRMRHVLTTGKPLRN